MGVDLASIGLVMDSRPVVDGTKALDALADSAARVEPKVDSAAKAVEGLGASSVNVWRRGTEAQKTVDALGDSASRTGQKITVSNGQMADTTKILQAQAEQAKAAAQANVVLGNSTNQLTLGQQQLIDRFREQAATIGMSRAQLMAYQAAQMGVTAQTREAIAAVKAHEDAIKAATKAKEDAAKSAHNLKDTLGLLAKAYAALKVAEYIKDATMLAARYETLGVVLEVVGRNAGYTKTQMNAAADGIARMGITMIESRESAVKLVQAHVDLKHASELARIAQNAAVIGHMNSSEAFDRLVNGIARGNVLILRNIGINVNLQSAYREMADSLGKTTKELTENERVEARRIAVFERGVDINGVYEKSMDTAGKQILSMQRYTQDFKTTFGETFNEVLTVGVMALTGHLKDSNKAITDLSKNNDLEEWGHNLTNLFSTLANTVSNAFTTFQKFDTFARHMDARKAINADADAQSKAVSDSGNGMAEKDAFARVQRIESVRKAALAEEAADYEQQQFNLSGNFDRFERANSERMATRTAKKKAEAAAQFAVDKDYMEKTAAVQRAYAGYSLEIQQKAQKALADSVYVGTPTYRDTEGRPPKEKVDQAENTRLADQLKRIETATAAEKASTEYLMRIDEMRHKAGEMGDQEFYERRRGYAEEVAGAEIGSYNKQLAELRKHHNNTEAEAATNAKAIHDTSDKLAAAKAKFAYDDLTRDEEDRLRMKATVSAGDDAANKYISSLNSQAEAIEMANGKRQQSASAIAEEAAAQLRLAAAAMAVQAAGPAEGGHTQADADAAKGMLTTLLLQAEAQERIAKALRDGEAATAARKLADEAIRDWKDVGQSVAESLSNAFGTAGKAAGAMFKAYADNASKQLQLNKEMALAKKLGDDDPAKLKTINDIHRQSAQAQLKSYGDMADAARGFFSEGSRGYAAMDAAAKVMHATEVALSLVKGVNAVLTQGSGDPYSAFARMAAMAAVVVGLGVAIGGVNGSDTTAKDRQAAAGTGSVFGDFADKDGKYSAKSESIARSIALSAANSSIELNYTQGMLRALLNIQNSLSGLGNLLIRGSGVTGDIAPDALGTASKIGATLSSGVFAGPLGALADKLLGGKISSITGKIANAIFGGNTTALDTGVTANKTTVGGAAAGGIQAIQYTDMKKDGGWFRGDSYWTDPKQLGAEANAQFAKIIAGMAEGIGEAGKLLGVGGDAFTQRLNGFVVDIGKISTKGLTGEEIQKQLETTFSKLGDDMARYAVNGLAPFQKVGEGYLETLVRIGANYANLDAVLQSVGMTFGATGMSSIAAREELIALAGGIDELAGKSSSFAEAYLTEAERLAPVSKYVAEEMAKLGLASIDTREEFKKHVLGLNLANEAERKQYASLMDLAGAFAKTHAATVDLTKSQQAIADERADIEERLADVLLSSAEKVARERAKLDASNRGLFDQLKMAEAAKAAQDAAKTSLGDLIGKLQSFGDSARALSASLVTGSLSTLTPEQQYAELERQYQTTRMAGIAGDTKAQGNFASIAQAFLTASQKINGGDARYSSDFAGVLRDSEEIAKWTTAQVDVAQASLDAMNAQVIGIGTLNDTMLEAVQTLKAMPSVIATPDYSRMGTSDKDALVAEIKSLKDDLVAEIKGRREDAKRQTGDTIGGIASAVAKGAEKVVGGIDDAGTNARSRNWKADVNDY